MYNISKIVFSAVVILFFNTVNVYSKTIAVSGSGDFNDIALDSVVVSGSAEAKNSEFKTFVVSGSVEFINLRVTELFTVSGDARGEKLDCNRIVVNGHFKGEDVLVSGDAVMRGGFEVTRANMHANTKIAGGLDARHSKFHDLEVDSDEITLSDSTANNITVNWSSKYEVQKIILKGKTVIAGDIIFKSGTGKIIADKEVVVKGKVEGAKLQKK